MSGTLVRLGVSVALKALYGEDVDANVGADVDEEARRLTKKSAIEAVRRNRRGKSRQQVMDDLTTELRLRGLEPLLPIEQNLLLASLAAPFLPVRRLDDLGTSAYALAHIGRGAYTLLQRFHHADDEVEDAPSGATGPGGRHRRR